MLSSVADREIDVWRVGNRVFGVTSYFYYIYGLLSHFVLPSNFYLQFADKVWTLKFGTEIPYISRAKRSNFRSTLYVCGTTLTCNFKKIIRSCISIQSQRFKVAVKRMPSNVEWIVNNTYSFVEYIFHSSLLATFQGYFSRSFFSQR